MFNKKRQQESVKIIHTHTHNNEKTSTCGIVCYFRFCFFAVIVCCWVVISFWPAESDGSIDGVILVVNAVECCVG